MQSQVEPIVNATPRPIQNQRPLDTQQPTPKPALSSAQQVSAVFSAPGAFLTRREQEGLRLLATGASNQEIARTLAIEMPTVKKHISNLLGKLRATSRTQAISRARALSLL